MTIKTVEEKKKFSSFTVKEALKRLGLEDLTGWKPDFAPLAPTEFFAERLRRLENFDLTQTEDAKELLIEAVCEDVLERHRSLRAWKSVALSTDELTGRADYLIAKRRRYVETPLLCVTEAKRDDFEKGLGQCLAEMEACRWNNERDGILIDIYGIVTNGDGWRFYKLTVDNEVLETAQFSLANVKDVLGALGFVFTKCEENLEIAHQLNKELKR